jgi:putative endonuclease
MWPFRRAAERPLGPRGEKLAEKLLRRQGMKLLARNYRCTGGEIDLIALDRSTRKDLGAETVAFVEVKTRSSDDYTDPEAAVDAGKRRRIVRASRHYLASHPAAERLNLRYDIVSVLCRPGRPPQLRHIPAAFR